MADNLTGQVRNIAMVTTAIAKGDLTKKIDIDARGRDPRAEDHHQHDGRPAVVLRRGGHPGGPRGGHARGSWAARHAVEGVAGTWKRLTEYVNEMAGNLTRQVRAIAAVDQRGDPRRPEPLDRRGRVRRDPGAPGQHQHDDRQPARDHPRQQGAGLAQGQPRPRLRADAGPPRPADVAALIMSELAPAGRPPSTARSSSREAAGGRHRAASCDRLVRLLAGDRCRRRSGSGEALVGPAAEEKRTILVDERPRAATSRSPPGSARRPRSGDRAAGAVRGPGARRDRAGLASAASPRSSGTSSTSSPR